MSNLVKTPGLEAAKDKGTLRIYNAAKKILESNKKESPDRKCIHGAWIDNISEKQYLCTGYILIELNKAVEGLPQIEDGVTTLDGRNFFKSTGQYTEVTTIYPTALRLQLKQAGVENKAAGHKQKANPVTQIGASYYYIRQLLVIISVLGDKVEVHSEPTAFKPSILTSEIGRAYIVPVKINK